MKKVYEPFLKSADFYDLFYKNKNYKNETDYVLKKLSNKINLLDVGCGTGKHSFLFSKYKINVTGVEFSKKMINKKLENKYLKFINDDFLKFKPKQKFHNIVALFHVVNYMNSEYKIRKFFNQASNFLENKGRLIFDSWNVIDSNNQNQPTEKHIKTKNYDIFRFSKTKIYKDYIEVIFDFLVINHDAKNYHVFTEKHKMRPYSKSFFLDLAKENGLKLIENKEFLTEKKITTTTKSSIYVFEKKYSS